MGKKQLSFFLPLMFLSHIYGCSLTWKLRKTTCLLLTVHLSLPVTNIFVPNFLPTVLIPGQFQSSYNWKSPTRVVRFSDSKISLATVRQEAKAAPGRRGCSHLAAVSSVTLFLWGCHIICHTSKWWAGGRLRSTVAKGEIKEIFQDKSSLETDILHWH